MYRFTYLPIAILSLFLSQDPHKSPQNIFVYADSSRIPRTSKIDTEEIDWHRDPLAAVHYSPIPSYSHPQHISGPRNQSPRNTFLRTVRKPLIIIVRHDHLSHIHIFFCGPSCSHSFANWPRPNGLWPSCRWP